LAAVLVTDGGVVGGEWDAFTHDDLASLAGIARLVVAGGVVRTGAKK
jgi:hypothetical protein